MTRILLFNKPYNVLSQFTDPARRATLRDYINLREFKVAGRLDLDSEGLMVLTNSGTMAHKITHPARKMSKNYWVQVEGELSNTAVEQLARGVNLKDGPTQPAKCKAMMPPVIWPRRPPIRHRKTIPTSWLSLTITEGRNRQVRRMCAAVGFPVLRLIRYRVGSWTLDGLAPGEWQIINLPDWPG